MISDYLRENAKFGIEVSFSDILFDVIISETCEFDYFHRVTDTEQKLIAYFDGL